MRNQTFIFLRSRWCGSNWVDCPLVLGSPNRFKQNAMSSAKNTLDGQDLSGLQMTSRCHNIRQYLSFTYVQYRLVKSGVLSFFVPASLYLKSVCSLLYLVGRYSNLLVFSLSLLSSLSVLALWSQSIFAPTPCYALFCCRTFVAFRCQQSKHCDVKHITCHNPSLATKHQGSRWHP